MWISLKNDLMAFLIILGHFHLFPYKICDFTANRAQQLQYAVRDII